LETEQVMLVSLHSPREVSPLNMYMKTLRTLSEERSVVIPSASPLSPLSTPRPLPLPPDSFGNKLFLRSPSARITGLMPMSHAATMGFSRSQAGLPWDGANSPFDAVPPQNTLAPLRAPPCSPRAFNRYSTESRSRFGAPHRLYSNHRQYMDSSMGGALAGCGLV
jgi:hypothetical protein